MKLYGFANAVDYQSVPYGCACLGLIVLEALTWLLKKGIFIIMIISDDLHVYIKGMVEIIRGIL